MNRSIVISYVFHGKDDLKDFKEFLNSIKKYPPAPSTILSVTVKQIPDALKIKMQRIIVDMNLQLIVKFHHFPDIGFGQGTHYLINEIYNPKIIIFMTARSKFNNIDWFINISFQYITKKELVLNPTLEEHHNLVYSNDNVIDVNEMLLEQDENDLLDEILNNNI